MFKKFYIFMFLILLSSNLFSKSLKFNGLSKLNSDDIQSITSVDIYNNNLEIDEINILIKELSTSQLIYNVDYTENNDHFFPLIILLNDLIVLLP